MLWKWLEEFVRKGFRKGALPRQESPEIPLTKANPMSPQWDDDNTQTDYALNGENVYGSNSQVFYPSEIAPLRETKDVRQIEKNGFRRWFTSDYLDLIVWYKHDKKTLVGFQLCYNVGYNEHALSWTVKNGYKHNRIDDGQDLAGSAMTPILVPDGIFDSSTVADIFRKASTRLDPEVAGFVYNKIRDFQLL